jgi:hypothetical protein
MAEFGFEGTTDDVLAGRALLTWLVVDRHGAACCCRYIGASARRRRSG